MILNYLSNWSLGLFCIALLFNITPKDLNLYYLVYFCFYGFIGYLMYHIFYKKLVYSPVYLIFAFLCHYIPMYYYQKRNIKASRNALLIFLFVSMIYLYYIHKREKNIVNLYIYDEQITSFSDFMTR